MKWHWKPAAAALMYLGDMTLGSPEQQSPDLIGARPLGPACLADLLDWRGQVLPTPHHKILGGLVDKVYVIHYSKATTRRQKMEETLRNAGIDPSSPAVDFVTAYDREDPKLQKLKPCLRCGFKDGALGSPDAVCSVSSKHAAAYADMVRNGYSVSLLLEDDIALTGPRLPSTRELGLGLTPWPSSSSSSSSSKARAEAANSRIDSAKFNRSRAVQDGEPALTAGLRSLFHELEGVVRNASNGNASNHLPVVGSADSSGSHSSDNNPDGVSPEKIRLFNASDGEPLPVAEDPGFDVILLGDCVFTRWEDKHTDTTPRSDHIFQPDFKHGASKCVGAVLIAQRGAMRLLQGLPLASPGLYKANDRCYRTPGGYPDHHLNLVHRLSGSAFRGYWAVPELCSEMALSASDSHIWRSHSKASPNRKKTEEGGLMNHNRSRDLFVETQPAVPLASVVDGMQVRKLGCQSTKTSSMGEEPTSGRAHETKEYLPVAAPKRSSRRLRVKVHGHLHKHKLDSNCSLPW